MARHPDATVRSLVQLGGFIGLLIFFGLVFGLGELLLRVLADRLDSRLQAGWRWLTLPIAAVLCFAGFLALRPLILEHRCGSSLA